MRVAHLIDALGWGGAQTLLLTFTETAQRFGVETVIISVRPDGVSTPIPDLLRSKGAYVVELAHQKIYDPLAVPMIAWHLKKEKIDLVHTHLSHSNIFGCIAGKITHIPSVATLHNTFNVSYSSWRLRQSLEHFCLRNWATRVIAVGQNVAAAYSSIVDYSKLDVIPNSVRPGKIISSQERIALRNELSGDASRPLIVAVGRLTEQKGYHDMLIAFAQVCQRHPDVFLAVIGTGPLRSELEVYIDNLGIRKNVCLVGVRNDVPYILAASDIFLNSSRWEGLSIAMLEAMAMGLPVVATRVGDAEQLLGSGGGILVESGDTQSLALALIQLLEDRDTRIFMGKVARDHVEDNYSADSWFKKLLSTYSQAIYDSKRLENNT